MRVYKFKRETSEGTFSLLNAQITIGELSDTRGNRLKGAGLISPNSVAEYPFPISDEQAALFVCLEQALRRELPVKTSIRFGWLNLWAWTLTLNSYDDEWMGVGGYKGSCGLQAQWTPIEMSTTVVTGMRDCLIHFYGLATPAQR